MKKHLLILTFLFAYCSYAQKSIVPTKNAQPSFLMADFLSVEMPKLDSGRVERNMGIIGIHLNRTFNKYYVGLGMYGAVSGERGGFFTLGLNAGYKFSIYKNLILDTGFHFGGGGGASTPDGGGAFILPHLNLGVEFKNISVTTGYSYINFFDQGEIESHQLNASIHIPLKINSASITAAQKEYSLKDLQASSWNTAPLEISAMMHLNNLLLKKGKLSGKTIRLAGFEFNTYLDKNKFLFLKLDGAYHGIRAGYMDIILGTGYHISMNNNKTNVIGKLGIGAGGGGGVDTKGGFLIYPDLSIEQELSNNIFISLNTGLLMSPNRHFESTNWGLGLKYYLKANGVTDVSSTSTPIFKGVEVILKQDLYIDASRMTKNANDLYSISLQLNYQLNDRIYLAGQTAFANFRDGGAYAEGIVGIGWQTNYFANEKYNFFIQSLAGAAGGGGINTGQGAIIKPSVGMNYKINSDLAFRGALGYIKSMGGGVSSPTINIGLNCQLAFLKL